MIEHRASRTFANSIRNRPSQLHRAPGPARFSSGKSWLPHYLLLLITTFAAYPCRADDTPAAPKTTRAAAPADAQNFWVETDYLLRSTRGNPLPPLVTASPAGTPFNAAGVLPGSKILFGGNTVDGDGRNGASLALGYWFHPEQRWAFEAGVDWLGDNGGTNFAASSDGSSFLARPFIDAILNRPSSMVVSAPGLLSGSVSSSTFSQVLSAYASLRKSWRQTSHWRIDLLGGYRYFQYRETLNIQQNSTVLGGLLPVGTTLSGGDAFNGKTIFTVARRALPPNGTATIGRPP